MLDSDIILMKLQKKRQISLSIDSALVIGKLPVNFTPVPAMYNYSSATIEKQLMNNSITKQNMPHRLSNGIQRSACGYVMKGIR